MPGPADKKIKIGLEVKQQEYSDAERQIDSLLRKALQLGNALGVANQSLGHMGAGGMPGAQMGPVPSAFAINTGGIGPRPAQIQAPTFPALQMAGANSALQQIAQTKNIMQSMSVLSKDALQDMTRVMKSSVDAQVKEVHRLRDEVQGLIRDGKSADEVFAGMGSSTGPPRRPTRGRACTGR